jgi:tetratricopeptide (TPR) repeat protein
LNSDPFDRKAIIDLGRYYRGLRAYAEGETVLSNYLSRFPKDEEARYLLAKIYSEDLKLDNALNECDTLLILSPENLDYKLLTAQLNIWAKRDLSLAEKLLDDVLSAREDDIYALIAAGLLNLLHNKPEKAEEYTSRAKAVDPTNPDLKDLIKLVESESIRKEEDSYMETLNKGREIAKEGDCKTALSYFEQYMDRYPDNYKIQEEYASILVCADYFSEAIDIYDKLLDEQYDLELDKTRAKIYYWSGDSLKAYDELQRLVLEDPQDMEMQLYFGDVNAKMKNYEAAKEIYLALKKRAPKSYLINQRLEWLPAEFHETTTLGRIFGGITNYVFSFMNLNPLTSYYNDNLGFEYYYYGAQLGIGFTKYVSLGGSFYSGNLNNTSTSSNRLSFTTTKLNVFINPMKELSIGLGYGRLNSKGILNTPVYDAQITYTPLANLQTSLRFEHTDGAFQLFSNDLINKRILSNNIKFDGNYTMNGGLYLESYYSLLWTENSIYEGKNVGNYFQVRIGKLFTNNMKFGYEYHFEDYKYNSPLYYTPQVFVSHSIWGDWEVFQTDLWRFKIGGKLGYVPESDFILREVKTEVSYKIIDSLKLLATGFLSSSIQDVTAYSSGAFYLNLFWSIY